MKCENVQNTILVAGDDLPANVKAHIDACSECQEFLATCRMVQDVPAAGSPGRDLDEAVLRGARERVQLQGRTAPAPLIGWFRPVRVAAAAATVGVLAGLTYWAYVAQSVPGDQALTQAAWEDTDIEQELLVMETQLEWARMISSASDSSVDSSSTAGSRGQRTIDDALLDLSMELLFEEQKMNMTIPHSDDNDSAGRERPGSVLPDDGAYRKTV